MNTTEKIELGDTWNGHKCIGFCPTCGAPIFDNDKFEIDEYGCKILDECPNCGDYFVTIQDDNE